MSHQRYLISQTDIQISAVIEDITSLDKVKVRNITLDTLATTHLRYMSGGRSSSTSDEYVFRILLPEIAGSLGTLHSLL